MRILFQLARVFDESGCSFLFNVLDDASGATAIEYGLIAALIAVASVVVMSTVGTNLSGTFNTVATTL